MSEYSYNAICDSCGFKRKASDLRKRWDGVMVCADTCWEPRNILDFYKTRNDQHVLPFTRSDDTGETDWHLRSLESLARITLWMVHTS